MPKWTRDVGEAVGGDWIDVVSSLAVTAGILAAVSLGLIW